jgi:hypothetical protein
LQIQVDPQNDIVIEDKEFFVAATLNQLENASIDLPLVVAKISHLNWKLVE